MKPFSDKIIFVDTEFTGLDPYNAELLSVGMVKLNGEEFYIEIEHKEEISDGFVKSQVLPYLIEEKISREEAKKKILEFVGKEKPFMVATSPFYDVICLHKLFGVENSPFNIKTIDLNAILFGLGIDPEKDHGGEKPEFYQKLGIDRLKSQLDGTVYRKHHALDDAKFVRELYLKFLEL
jgi:DNA polymerase III epsilon subunit-like protein